MDIFCFLKGRLFLHEHFFIFSLPHHSLLHSPIALFHPPVCECVHVWQIVRKVVRRGKGSSEEGVQELSVEGSLQDANELEGDTDQYMSYAILGRDSSKVGFWSAGSCVSHLRLPLLAAGYAVRLNNWNGLNYIRRNSWIPPDEVWDVWFKPVKELDYSELGKG